MATRADMRRCGVSAAAALLFALAATGVAAAAESTTYTYDALGRLASVSVVGPVSYVVTYTYDAAGNRTARTTTVSP